MAEKTDSSTGGSTLSGGDTLARGVKIVGETLVAPGTSLILDGKILAGGVHVVAGVLAKVALGPLGCLLVAANSYSKSVSGQNLHEHLLPAKN